MKSNSAILASHHKGELKNHEKQAAILREKLAHHTAKAHQHRAEHAFNSGGNEDSESRKDDLFVFTKFYMNFPRAVAAAIRLADLRPGVDQFLSFSVSEENGTNADILVTSKGKIEFFLGEKKFEKIVFTPNDGGEVKLID